MLQEPKTLQEAMVFFNDPANCREYVMARRWADGVACPTCGSIKVTFSVKHNRWQCGSHHPKRQFTIKTGTIFEDSPLGLDKWLLAMWMVINCKNGVSSYEISRDLGITQKSAWFILHRLREIMSEDPTAPKLSGEVEADETFVGGSLKNMHLHKRNVVQAREGRKGAKSTVIGLIQREGRVRAAVAPSRHKHELHPHIIANVEPGSKLFTDEWVGYDSLPADFTREVINHMEGYVRDNVSTNQIENFWSILKRGLKGTYVSVDPAHLQAYVNEQMFRFNNRTDMNDGDRFDLAVRKVTGKRLTWDTLINRQPIARP